MFSKSRGSLMAHPLVAGESLGARLWPDLGLLILRVYAGVTMAGGGLDKIPVDSWFTGQVESIGFPLPRLFAFLAAFAEFGGGWLLVLGLCARPAAFFMAITMGVASWTIHAEIAFWGLNIARIYFWVYVCLTFTGGGRFSLDHLTREERLPGFVAIVPVLVLAGIGGYHELFIEPQVKSAQTISIDDVESVSVAGDFNDWTLDTNPMTLGDDGTWRATVEIEKTGPIEFKFAANNDWAFNIGAAEGAKSSFPLIAQGIANSDGEPPNIKAYIPEAGSYEFAFDPDDVAYALNKANVIKDK